MKFKGRLRRFKEYLLDSSVNVKDRSFIVFSNIIIAELIFVATPLSILQGEPLSGWLSTLIGALILGIYVMISLWKRKLGQAKIVISIFLIFLFLPVMFFTNGGAYGGVAVSLLLGGIYINLILEGRTLIVMNLLFTGMMILCWVLNYNFPELVMAFTPDAVFADSLSGLLIVNGVIAILLSFNAKLYRKENEKADEKSKELEEMNRSQNRFFSSMSHEIRTPINTVLGLNEIILRQEDASDEIKKDAQNIRGAGKLLLALINDILDVSKIEAGKMDIVPVNYKVSSLLSEIVNMIWLKAEEKGLEFRVDIDPEVPEVLFGDEIRIKQILINLLNNAVKYTKEGSVSLHMECEFTEDGNALLSISVSDTGMGIKADALPHLFDTFRRVDEEENRYIEGTGLGLSIVKQLVELMDGEISVNSVYTQGSTFLVQLKQGIGSDQRIGDISITGAGTMSDSGRFEHSFHAPKARILIVDDNEMNLQVEKKLLDGTEMTVDLVMSGAEALGRTLKNYYDVIFMDHLMPEMDGIQCFEKIRSQSGGLNRRTPVIVLTANAGGENIELYNNTGFDGYLVKPVSGRQLEEMLLRQLPEDKIERNAANEMTGSRLNTASGYAKKRPVAILTSSMSDLPESVRTKLQIVTIPYTVTTDDGVFLDNVDMDSEELVGYLGDEHRFVTSEPPTVDALLRLFSAELKKAHHLIYITLTTGNSREYSRVKEAAQTFGNVSVVNSECLSSATGIVAMVAARLAQQNQPVEKILSELEEVKKRIRCSFVIKSTDIMARRGHISPAINGLLNGLWLRPVLRMKNDKLGAGSFLMGTERKCYEKYILSELSGKVQPDTDFVFVTYVGMSEEDLLWIEKTVREKGRFKQIVFQKASAGIASNCGEGSFGLLYLQKGEKSYNLGNLFREEFEEDEEEDSFGEEFADKEEEDRETAAFLQSEEDGSSPDEKEWYEKIPEIDASAAKKNCGSTDSLLTALQIYYDSFDVRSEELRTFYEEQNWEDYTIKVHALKSSSRLVGALELADLAEALEMAGKRKDIDFIRAHHDNLMEQYRLIRDAFSPAFTKEEELPPVPPEMLSDAYAGMAEFAETMDYDLMKMVMDSVKEYRLPKEEEERFERLKDLLLRMDWEAIKEVLKERT